MSKIFQIVRKKCHWLTPFHSLEEIEGKFPEDCLFVEAPDYVNEQWGYNPKATGDDRFVMPVAPDGWFYDLEAGRFIEYASLDSMLEDEQKAKQEENKNKFNEYLQKNPLLYTDGKYYGVTYEDQSEIALNMQQYQLQVQMIQAAVEAGEDTSSLGEPILEWHSINSACVPWTPEQLSDLAMMIKSYVYPIYNLMQKYKEKIYSFDDYKVVPKYEIEYSADLIEWIKNGNELDTYVSPEEEERKKTEFPTDDDVVESEGTTDVTENTEPTVEESVTETTSTEETV